MAKENLGQLISELRRKNNMSQKELAEKLDVSSSNLSKWEHGHLSPGIDVLEKIADLFQLTLDDLLHPEATLQRMQQDIYEKNEVIADASPQKDTYNHKRKYIIVSLVLAGIILLSGSIVAYWSIQPRYEVVDTQYNENGPYGIHYMMSVYYRGHWNEEDFNDFMSQIRAGWEDHEFAEDADAVEVYFYRSRNNAINWELPERISGIL